MSIRILIVDNNDLSRLKLRIYLEDLPDLSTIDEARTTFDALKILKEEAMALLIINGQDLRCLLANSGTIKEKSLADVRILALVKEEDLPFVPSEHIDGWCLQSVGPAELYTAIANVMNGFLWVDAAIAQFLLGKRSVPGLLAVVHSLAGKIEPSKICAVLGVSQSEYNVKLRKELNSISGRAQAEPSLPKQASAAVARDKVETLQFKPQLKEVLSGRFELQDLLEQGGMADVYKAWDSTLRSYAAIKFLNSSSSRDRSFSRRLAQEAEVLRLLSHPNIVRFLGSGLSADGQPYIAMSFVEGISLDSILQEEGSLPLQRAIPIFIQVCDALAHAHSLGVIHRDLTPHNILLTQGNPPKTVKLIDFGLSKWMPRLERSRQRMTRTGVVCGTPTYMSPEQCVGSKEIDHRSDIYALGCLLYEVATGVPPFIGASVMDTMRMHMHEHPKAITEIEPNLPHSFCQIAMQCLMKDPGARIQSAEQVKLLLSMVELPTQKENTSG